MYNFDKDKYLTRVENNYNNGIKRLDDWLGYTTSVKATSILTSKSLLEYLLEKTKHLLTTEDFSLSLVTTSITYDSRTKNVVFVYHGSHGMQLALEVVGPKEIKFQLRLLGEGKVYIFIDEWTCKRFKDIFYNLKQFRMFSHGLGKNYKVKSNGNALFKKDIWSNYEASMCITKDKRLKIYSNMTGRFTSEEKKEMSDYNKRLKLAKILEDLTDHEYPIVSTEALKLLPKIEEIDPNWIDCASFQNAIKSDRTVVVTDALKMLDSKCPECLYKNSGVSLSGIIGNTLKQVEINKLKKEIERLEKENLEIGAASGQYFKRLTESQSTVNNLKTSLDNQISHTEELMQDKNKKIEELEKKLKDKDLEFYCQKDVMAGHQLMEIMEFERKIKELEEKLSKYRTRNIQLSSRNSYLEDELKRYEQYLVTEENKGKKISQQLTEASKNVERLELNKKRLSSEMLDKYRTIKNLKNDITRLQGELGLKEGMNITLDNKLNDLQQDVLALENQMTNKDRTIEALLDRIKQLQ